MAHLIGPDGREPSASRQPPPWAVATAVAILSALFVLLCADSIRNTSAAYDEPGFLVAGYSYVAPGCPEVLTANLRLSQFVQALPLLALKPRPSFPADYAVPGRGMKIDVDLGWLFLKDPRNDAAAMLAASRSVTVGLALVLGWILFARSRRIFGDAGGVLTLGLYCCNPVIVSNSALATTDMPTTLAFVVATLALSNLIRGPGWKTALASGLAVGCLLATKVSGLLIVPVAGVLLALEVASGEGHPARPGRLAAWALGAAALVPGVIWAIYGFRFRADRLYPDEVWAAVSRPGSGLVAHIINACRIRRLLPQAYLYDFQRCLFSLPNRHAFLDGNYSADGWLRYFPEVFAVKSPFAFLAALGLGLAGAYRLAWRNRRKAGQGDGQGGQVPESAVEEASARARSLAVRGELAPFLALGVVYGGAAVWSRFNIGIRHLLPAYPALFVLAGATVTLWPRRRSPGVVRPSKITGWIPALVLTVACGAETIAFRPNYLAYVNALGGGAAHGYRFLADSALDWGEYLPSVQRWVDAPGRTGPTYFAYQGDDSPHRYSIRAHRLPGTPDRRPISPYRLVPGTYILSASLLESTGGGPVWGPWRKWDEDTYDSLLPEYGTLSGPPARPAVGWEDRYWTFDLLRFGRLCAFLRGREPDARITPAVLVFELGQADLDAALRGPPPGPAAGETTR